MSNTNINATLGSLFRMMVVDKETGVVKSQSDWQHNLILNVAKNYMQLGFDEEPSPKLGSSLIDVDVSQTGVQAPIAALALTGKKELWPATFTRTTTNAASVSWGTQYTYQNNSAGVVTVSEIGIDNFNRLVFRDDQGGVRSWSISPNENIIVEMEFVIAFTTSSNPVTITTVNNAGETLNTYNVNLTVSNQITAGTPRWWKLLSKPSTNVKLVTATTFNGVNPPADSAVVVSNIPSTYTYTDRTITISIQHRAPSGGQTFKGMLVEFGCLSPAFGYVYNNTIRVGGDYTYKSNVTVTW